MAQYVRFGYLQNAPDYKTVADKLVLQDLYAEVANGMKIPIPEDDMRPFTLDLDKVVFDPNAPDTAAGQE
jgi:nitrate/nitrite transport system substrate-binding protein